MSAGDVTAEEMEQAIENARTAVFRDPPWSPNARAFLAILTERDQLNAEVAAIRRQLEERRVVVQEPPEEKELYDTLGDEEYKASYEAVSHYLMGWRHCSESIRPLSSGEAVATPPADVVTVLQRFVDWCEKYPSSRIYNHCQIITIARIMDEIHADAKRALRSGEAGKEKA